MLQIPPKLLVQRSKVDKYKWHSLLSLSLKRDLFAQYIYIRDSDSCCRYMMSSLPTYTSRCSIITIIFKSRLLHRLIFLSSQANFCVKITRKTFQDENEIVAGFLLFLRKSREEKICLFHLITGSTLRRVHTGVQRTHQPMAHSKSHSHSFFRSMPYYQNSKKIPKMTQLKIVSVFIPRQLLQQHCIFQFFFCIVMIRYVASLFIFFSFFHHHHPPPHRPKTNLFPSAFSFVYLFSNGMA